MARKKQSSVMFDEYVLEEARKQGINISATCNEELKRVTGLNPTSGHVEELIIVQRKDEKVLKNKLENIEIRKEKLEGKLATLNTRMESLEEFKIKTMLQEKQNEVLEMTRELVKVHYGEGIPALLERIGGQGIDLLAEEAKVTIDEGYVRAILDDIVHGW